LATFRTIKDLVIDSYLSKGSLPGYEELTELVRAHFSRSKWKETHYAWYKSKIKNGKITPGPRKNLEIKKVVQASKNRILDLSGLRIQDLFKLHEDISVELIERNIIHSSNNIIANYSEKLACESFGLIQMPESTKGYDAKDSKGLKYEIKGRKPTVKNKSRQLSALRGLDDNQFDFLIAILFEGSFEVKRAAKIPHAVVLKKSTFVPRTKSWTFHIRDEIWDIPGVEDITQEVKRVEAKHSEPQLPKK
jgi:hypothetical protein